MTIPIINQGNVQSVLHPTFTVTWQGPIGHPVFILRLNDGRKIVAKSDKKRDQGLSPKILEYDCWLFSELTSRPFEIRLGSDNERNFLQNINPNLLVIPYQTPDWNKYRQDAHTNMVQLLSGNSKFLYFMEFVQGLLALDDIAGKLSDTRKFIAALGRKEGFVKEVGKIAAVDMVIGNTDRFDVDPNSGAIGQLVNVGNLFMERTAGGGISVIGLDPLDPNSEWSDLSKTIPALEASHSYGGLWPGRILGDNALMDKFSEGAISSMAGVFRQVQELGASNPLTPTKKYAAGLKAGLIEARAGLIQKFKIAPTQFKTGLESRLAILQGGVPIPKGVKGLVKKVISKFKH